MELVEKINGLEDSYEKLSNEVRSADSIERYRNGMMELIRSSWYACRAGITGEDRGVSSPPEGRGRAGLAARRR